MTEYTIHQLERTEKHLARHLEDLNDQIDQDGGRIKDHMDLDGIKDTVKSLHMIHGMLPDKTADAAESKRVV